MILTIKEDDEFDVYVLDGEASDWYEWDYVESEGKDTVRYDWNNGSLSLWVNADGSANGHAPISLKTMLEAIPGINTEDVEYT